MAIFLWQRPSQLYNQHFGEGLDLDDLIEAITTPVCISKEYTRPWRSISRSTSQKDSGSKISQDKDGFHVSLDVQHFAPEEISVKTDGKFIIIEGKHEEKEDEHGTVWRHFIRRYALPESSSSDNIVSNLTADGQLTVTAPKKQMLQDQVRVVPINVINVPHKQTPPPAEEKKD